MRNSCFAVVVAALFFAPVGGVSPLYSLSMFPSRYGVSGLFGLGYGAGDGFSVVKNSLEETADVSAETAGSVVLGIQSFAYWSVIHKLYAGISLSLSPVSFSVNGYSADGALFESRDYIYLAADLGVSVSYMMEVLSGYVHISTGPLLGLRIGDGRIVTESEGLSSSYTVPAGQMADALPGYSVDCEYLYPFGPGFIDAGIKIIYHYFRLSGFLSADQDIVDVITPVISIGYSFGDKNNVKR